MNPEQMTPVHHARLAYVYIRQSTPQQVLHPTESQRRQRCLVHRAVDLGWPKEQVVLVDEDLGQSAARTQQRTGIENMLGEVALGKVGLIFVVRGFAYFTRQQ